MTRKGVGELSGELRRDVTDEPERESPDVRRDAGPILAVRDLVVGFGNQAEPVVRGVSFHVNRGEALAIVGESGSGKSVTARSVLGLAGDNARVAASELSFDGVDLRHLRERQWRGIRSGRIGLVLQDALVSLDPFREVGREVEEVLSLHSNARGPERRRRALDALTRAGIPDAERRARQIPAELSGGLRQRALIATAIAADPDLIIADEPTTALDVTVQAQVLALLRGLVDRGRSLLLISHDLAVVASVADRVLVVRHGEVVEEGDAADVLARPRHPYTKQLLAAVPSAASRGRRLSGEPPSAYIERVRDASHGGDGRQLAGERRSHDGGDHPVVLEAAGLAKSFGTAGGAHLAVDDVSFALRRGETLGIVGESGSGKSTTARLALGIEKPDRGSVRLDGRDWNELGGRALRAARLSIQAVHQDALSTFDPRHTVGAILTEALAASGVRGGAELRARSAELLALVGLDDGVLDRRPLRMSGGQRQRVSIARALAPRPDVLVCDEPVSALDVSIQAQVLDLLVDVQRATGVAYLFISHDLGVISHIADRVLVMKDGRVVEHGEVRQIFERPEHPYTRRLLDAVPRLEAALEAAPESVPESASETAPGPELDAAGTVEAEASHDRLDLQSVRR